MTFRPTSSMRWRQGQGHCVTGFILRMLVFRNRPPTQAVDALLHRVVFRRRIGVESCLRQLTLLLAEQPGFFGSCHVDLMVASLSPWSESVRLPVLEGQDGDFRENERPDLRVQLGGFAAALSEWLRNKLPRPSGGACDCRSPGSVRFRSSTRGSTILRCA